MDKTDEMDAFVIADYLRFSRLPMSVVKEEQYVALQQLTWTRYQLVYSFFLPRFHVAKRESIFEILSS